MSEGEFSGSEQGYFDRRFMAIVDGHAESPDGVPGELFFEETPPELLSPVELNILICGLLTGGDITEADAAQMRRDAGLE